MSCSGPGAHVPWVTIQGTVVHRTARGWRVPYPPLTPDSPLSRVKPAIFDLLLAVCIGAYLGMAYTAVQVSTGPRLGGPGVSLPPSCLKPVTAQVPGPSLVGLFPASLVTTCALLLPPALRPPVQNSSETAPEGQDTVTSTAGPPPPPSPPSVCRGLPRPRITELFCVALEDLGDSFSFLSFELLGGAFTGTLGPSHGLGNKSWPSLWPGRWPRSPQGAKLCYRRKVTGTASGPLLLRVLATASTGPASVPPAGASSLCCLSLCPGGSAAPRLASLLGPGSRALALRGPGVWGGPRARGSPGGGPGGEARVWTHFLAHP